MAHARYRHNSIETAAERVPRRNHTRHTLPGNAAPDFTDIPEYTGRTVAYLTDTAPHIRRHV